MDEFKPKTQRKRPHPIDVHVGAKVREKRILAGLTQAKLGEPLDLSFQQVQKYEKGINRIGASRLFEIARVLNVSLAELFEGLEVPTGEALPDSTEEGLPLKRESMDMMSSYRGIKNKTIRKHLSALAKAVKEGEDD